MAKIKISEKFLSSQGEGMYMGVPSVFLRTFGCNFTCQGFGMPRGQLSTEADNVAKNADKYKSFQELPIVSSGCDSYPSWHMGFKNLSPMLTTDEIAEQIVDLLPNKKWNREHLVITGGEPLLGWQRSYPALLDHPKMQNLVAMTFETNGTQRLDPKFKLYLADWIDRNNRDYRSLTFSVSPKLSISGEKREDAIKPEVIVDYESIGVTYLKYVVETEEDVKEALEVTEMYRAAGFVGEVYLMPVGGTPVGFQLTRRQVADLALKHGVRFSDRLQVSLYNNEWGT